MADLTATFRSTPQVLFGSAPAVAVPPTTAHRWTDAIGSAVRSWLAGPEEPAKRHRPQHYRYLESALMAREMGRL